MNDIQRMNEFVVLLAVLGVILTGALIGATIMQQRRYLRTRHQLGGRLLEAQDEERAAIARELHDDTVQRLLALAKTLRKGNDADLPAVADEAEQLATELRGLARGMHPSVVDLVGLQPALKELANGIEDREGILVELHGELPGDALTPQQRLALYRVAQEALGNAARHAQVARVRMELSGDNHQVRLEITDEGQGFDPEVISLTRGIGITSMRERMRILGGQLECLTSPGFGTRIIAVLPRQLPQ
jgi:signal transduction histidine kinase